MTGDFTENEEVVPTALTLKGDVITVETPIGSFDVKCKIKDSYFTFELVSALPEASYKALLAHAKYDYDYKEKSNTGAVGIAITYWADPSFYPDAKSLETKAEVTRTLRDKGAKYALIIAPINEQKDIIKEVTLTIDKNTGITSKIGGAWGGDSRLNFGNYSLQYSTERSYIKNNVDTFKEMSIDQLDFHQGSGTYRQGDFYHYHYENHAEFKKYVSDVLEESGMSAGLHTYSFYLAYSCAPYLSNPKWQKQLGCIGEYTIAEDIGEEDIFIKIEEPTSAIYANRGFNARNSPFILVGEEIMYFVITENGLQIDARGCVGTKRVAHKKGEKIRHIDGKYAGIAPIPGSELYLEIAKETDIFWQVHRAAHNADGLKGVEIETIGDMTDVKMSSITVYEHTYEILKNPTVKIGEGSLMFECELMSSDFIEFDGENAKVVDRFGNEKPIWFNAENFKAPRGKFKASLEARALNRTTPMAKLTLGFTGKEVK